jgi:hypothetical protein
MKGINIGNLGASPDQKQISGVTVIWTAPRRHSGGTYVVGWYKNAIVHREEQAAPRSSKRPIPKQQGESCGYFIEANAKEKQCLHPDLRTLLVPRGKNGMGQANVWYPQTSRRGKQFLTRLKAFIRTGGTSLSQSRKENANHRTPDNLIWSSDRKLNVWP